jgi:hypothetical protein
MTKTILRTAGATIVVLKLFFREFSWMACRFINCQRERHYFVPEYRMMSVQVTRLMNLQSLSCPSQLRPQRKKRVP